MPAFLAVALLAALPTYRLVDSVGEPVRGATVRVVGASTASRTNDSGQFRLDPAPAPPFEIAVFGPHGALIGHARIPSTASLVLSGSNLLDESYPPSPDTDAPPAPGQSLGVSLQARR